MTVPSSAPIPAGLAIAVAVATIALALPRSTPVDLPPEPHVVVESPPEHCLFGKAHELDLLNGLHRPQLIEKSEGFWMRHTPDLHLPRTLARCIPRFDPDFERYVGNPERVARANQIATIGMERGGECRETAPSSATSRCDSPTPTLMVTTRGFIDGLRLPRGPLPSWGLTSRRTCTAPAVSNHAIAKCVAMRLSAVPFFPV